MNMPQEIPVYLFTGFLDAGKTTFIQDALESRDFNENEQTLLLVCEEGEVEYEPDRFYQSDNEKVVIEQIEDVTDLSTFLLTSLVKKAGASRVIIEWNGMWSLSDLYENMPIGWMIYQQVMLADATTFLMYNRNIRQLTFEQLQGAEMVAFNRCKRDDKFEDWQMEVHKICRVANRKSQIIYEFGPDDAEPDNFVDPLPYDLSAPEITVTDDIYAEWYRDINEEQDKYEGKILKVKGRCALGGGLPENAFVFGRHVMTCCVEDIQFAGLLCKWNRAKKLKHGGWVEIKARVQNEYAEVYGEVGPVLYCQEVKASLPADPEVATF